MNIVTKIADQIDELDTRQRELIDTIQVDTMSDPDNQIDRLEEVRSSMERTIEQLENVIEAARDHWAEEEDDEEEIVNEDEGDEQPD